MLPPLSLISIVFPLINICSPIFLGVCFLEDQFTPHGIPGVTLHTLFKLRQILPCWPQKQGYPLGSVDWEGPKGSFWDGGISCIQPWVEVVLIHSRNSHCVPSDCQWCLVSRWTGIHPHEVANFSWQGIEGGPAAAVEPVRSLAETQGLSEPIPH